MIESAPTTHVRLDKAGIAWIDDTNVKVAEVIQDHLTYGLSPEEIHLQHPHLSLAQIHAAFAFYFDHQAEMDAGISRRFRRIEVLRERATGQPSRRQLLARLKRH